MTPYENLTYSQENGICTVRINRPDHRNALNADLIEELTFVARELKSDTSLRAVILTGTDHFFSAGADLSTLQDQLNPEEDVLTLRERLRAGPDMCRAWEEIEAITIAAIEGYCVGGACALAVACDFRLGSDTAMMRLPEVPLGMNMSWQTLPRLTALIGPARAKRFSIFGEATPAETLLDWGLIDEKTKQGQALAAAKYWAEQVADLPPVAVRMTKETINAVVHSGHSAISHMDRDQFLMTVLSGEIRATSPDGK